MAAQIGAGGTRGRRQASLADINVTPLVDVMLVLLIISLVAAPMRQRGIHLELPATASATEIQEARVVVSVDREARIRVNDRPVHPDLFADRMRGLAASNPTETVYLRADRLLHYGEVLLVMDTIRGRDVNEAYALLKFSKKHAARQIEKVLRSAVANAEQDALRNNDAFDVDRLLVEYGVVNEGPTLWRYRAAAHLG